MAEEPASQKTAQHRIAKLLARAGVASRRDVERMIEDGRVAVNGVVLDTPATLLETLAGVTVDGEPVAEAELTRLFLFHKPAGYLTAARDPMGRPTIYDRLPADLPRLMPVGRLDLNTEGLLLLTTDGAFKRQLELPSTGVERAYRARAYGDVTQAQLEALIDGVEIDGIRYGSIDANLERRTGANVWIEMILTEGKNREVRRVLEYLGLQVSRLIRTRYGPFVMGDLPVGEIGEVRGTDLVAFRNGLKNNTRLAPEQAGTITATAIGRGGEPRGTAVPHAGSHRAATPPDRDGYDPTRAPQRSERVPTRGAFGRPAREFANEAPGHRSGPFGGERGSPRRTGERDRSTFPPAPSGEQRRPRPSQGANEPDGIRSRRPVAPPRPALTSADERPPFRADTKTRANSGGNLGERASGRNRSGAIDPTHEARPFRDRPQRGSQSRASREDRAPRDRVERGAAEGGRSQRPGRSAPDVRPAKSAPPRARDRDEVIDTPRSPRPERKPGWARAKPKPGPRPRKPRK